MKAPSIYEIKRKNVENGGCFFCRANMKFSGDTLKSFKTFYDPQGVLLVQRKRDGKTWMVGENWRLQISNQSLENEVKRLRELDTKKELPKFIGNRLNLY